MGRAIRLRRRILPWIPALILASLILAGCGRGGTGVRSPWGPAGHKTGPVRNPDALRAALDWGRSHAPDARETLAGFYEVSLRQGNLIQRARVSTRWSRLALHAAERMRASLRPDPRTVERIIKGPALVITFLRRDVKKTAVTRIDMVLLQGGRRFYAPVLKRSPARPVKDGDRVIAYEGELEGEYPLDELDPRRSATLEVRLEDGSRLTFDIPLWRLR